MVRGGEFATEMKAMEGKLLKLLLVEDNPTDVLMLREALAETTTAQFDLDHVERLSGAVQRLGKEAFDVVLLDLSLPDSQGLDTLVQLQEQAFEAPVIVLTGTDDENLALKAVQMGAQDYLVKRQSDSNLLVRAIRYAVERHRLLAEAELEQTRQRQQQERELQSFDRLSGPPPTIVTARTFGMAPLRKSVPDTFNEWVQRYGDLMDLALEQRSFKVEHNLSERLRSIGESIGLLKAGPRDVVEIHGTALKRKSSEATPQKAQVYAEEGRLMVLELMGYLAAYYRTFSIGARKPHVSDTGQTKIVKGE